MADYCVICGNPDTDGNRYCLNCIRDVVINGSDRTIYVEEEPPPHKDDF